MYGSILAAIVVSCAVIDAADGLKCIECSSSLDDKCGKTFGYSIKEARDAGLEKTCEGMMTACKKTETQDTLNNKVIVTRSCWNATSSEKLKDEFFKCKELMTNVEVCYCKAGENDDPCNGQEQITVNWILSFLGLLPFIMQLI